MIVVTALLVLERVGRRSFRVSAAAGVALVAWGAWTAVAA
jgi:hypothetical protein